MSLEEILQAVLDPLAAGGAWPDTAPDAPAFPHIVYQQVGGQPLDYLENRPASDKHARVQVHVWADTRLQANQIARAVENAIRRLVLPTQTYGAFVALYERPINKRGTRQDFGIWYPDDAD